MDCTNFVVDCVEEFTLPEGIGVYTNSVSTEGANICLAQVERSELASKMKAWVLGETDTHDWAGITGRRAAP